MPDEFPRPKSDEWVRPEHAGYLMGCCDCALVHAVDFRVVDKDGREVVGADVEFRMRRDPAETRAQRWLRFPEQMAAGGGKVCDSPRGLHVNHLGDTHSESGHPAGLVSNGDTTAMKNLENLSNTLKSTPTTKARAGTFIQEFGQAVLDSADNPAQVRNIVQSVLDQKDEYADTIAHEG